MVDLHIEVNLSGPIVTGMAQREVERFARHVEDTLGEIGVPMIRNYLETQYMYLGHHGGTPRFNPIPANAGELQASVHTERATEDSLLITDDPVIYGAWIEGTDSKNLIVWPHRRNPPPRRFPGYHAFRRIAKSLNAMATPIAYRELPLFIRMMNGDLS
jgi:hypothetical protein